SSSGSAAAVADRMIQLAFGTQTGGSLIRPGAYTGIYGFKPTHGVVSNEGAKMYSPTLDTIGWYGRSVPDLQLVARAFQLHDSAAPRPVELKGLRVGLCRGPHWNDLTPGGQEALLTAAQRLEAEGAIVEDLALPPPFNELSATHGIIM